MTFQSLHTAKQTKFSLLLTQRRSRILVSARISTHIGTYRFCNCQLPKDIIHKRAGTAYPCTIKMQTHMHDCVAQQYNRVESIKKMAWFKKTQWNQVNTHQYILTPRRLNLLHRV